LQKEYQNLIKMNMETMYTEKTVGINILFFL
jgi:hypothetical protein